MKRRKMDYKEWISEQAESLAHENFNSTLSSLAENIQYELFHQAEQDYINRQVAKADALCEE